MKGFALGQTLGLAFKQRRKATRKTPIDRRFWTLPRTNDWFQIAETNFTDKEWYDNFCVSREISSNTLSLRLDMK